MLTESVERIFARDVYADIPRGIFLVRGENVLLLGEVVWAFDPLQLTVSAKIWQDLDKDDYVPEPYRQVSDNEAYEMQKQEKDDRKAADKSRAKKLHGLGFEVEHAGETLF